MRIFVLAIWALVFFSSCNEEQPNGDGKSSRDLTNYHSKDTIATETFTSYYVPVYSEIFSSTDKTKIQLTVTLSIRNISTSDKMYVSSVDYYSSHGEKLRSYLNKTIELNPLQSIDFVVEERDTQGGSGPCFVAKCAYNTNAPVIQAVMIGTLNQQGISYLTEGIPIK